MIEEAKLCDHFILKKISENLINFLNPQFDIELKKNLDMFYNIDETALISVFNSLKNNKKKLQSKNIKLLDKLFKDVDLQEINFMDFLYIKSSEDYVLCICSVLILKSFSQPVHQNKYNLQHENNILKKCNDTYSYAIINYINNNLIKFANWITLNNFITNHNDDYKDLIKLFLCMLTEDKLLIATSLTDVKRKTQIFYRAKDLKIKRHYDVLCASRLFFMPLKYIKKNNIFYTYTNHFSSMTSIFLKNSFSGASFVLGDVKLLDHLCTSYCYIDPDQIEHILNTKLKFYGLKKENLFNLYDSFKDALLDAVHANDVLNVSKYSQKISFYESLLKLDNLSKNILVTTKLYESFSFDFRGRLYYLSDASVTFNSDLRSCIFTLDNRVIDFTNQYKLKIEQTLKEHFHFLNKLKKFNFTEFSDSKKESVIWVLIYIAEFDKIKLGKEVSVENFLLRAIDIVNTFNNNGKIPIDDLERYLHITYGLHILNEIQSNSPKIWFLKKDCTASVYQILIKVLGHNDEIHLKHCNLNSENIWYDTYSFIIDNFLTQTKINFFIIENNLQSTLNRDNCKKPIMTETYNARFNTFKKYFLAKFSPDSLTYSLLTQKDFIDCLKEFNIFLKNNTFFKTNPKEIEKFILDCDGLIAFLDGSEVNLAYKKMKTFQVESLFEQTRITQKRRYPTSEQDFRKTKNSAKANYAHAQDATLMRQVLMWGFSYNLQILGIHDCWMLDYNNITNLVAVVNEKANISYHLIKSSEKKHEFYSFFIVI